MKKLVLASIFMSLVSVTVQAEVLHFVAFKYKSEVSDSQKKSVVSKFLALKHLSKRAGKNYILSIEAGKANSKEGFDQGMEQGFIVKFKSEVDRDYYVGKPFASEFDPAHEEFKQHVGPLLSFDKNGKLDGVYVFDFNSK